MVEKSGLQIKLLKMKALLMKMPGKQLKKLKKKIFVFLLVKVKIVGDLAVFFISKFNFAVKA